MGTKILKAASRAVSKMSDFKTWPRKYLITAPQASNASPISCNESVNSFLTKLVTKLAIVTFVQISHVTARHKVHCQ